MSPTRRKSRKRETAFRFELLNGFVDRGMADLTRAELAVWLVLFRDARPPDGIARTAVTDIAKRGGMSTRAAGDAVGKLAARKMLKIVRRGGLNQGPAVYQVFPYPME